MPPPIATPADVQPGQQPSGADTVMIAIPKDQFDMIVQGVSMLNDAVQSAAQKANSDVQGKAPMMQQPPQGDLGGLEGFGDELNKR